MECKTAIPVQGMNGQVAGNDSLKPGKIREKIMLVFGEENEMSDELLMKRYSLTVDGDLVMILR
jgi:hypothetical protein